MKSPFMLRKLLIIFLAISVGLTSVSCGSNNETRTNPSNPSVLSTKNVGAKLGDGKYEVQQATYNDANGEYQVMLLNTPTGSPPVFRNTNLQMARLTDEEVAAKQKAYLKIENGQASMHIPEDFKIEYVRSVAQEQTNPQTGQRETVVRREGGGFWAPFAGSVAGSLAGQAIGNAIFRPQHYVPPAYQPGGGLMRGYGGYGGTYDQAVGNYRQRYNQEPAAVRNRTTLRSTGRLNNGGGFGSGGSFGSNQTARPQVRNDGNKSSGSGFGTSRLGQSDNYRSRVNNSAPRSFGSSGGSRSSSGFGSRRR
jgi:hypothetical protein